MRRSMGKPIHSDFLEALDYHDPLKLNEFDQSLIGLKRLLENSKKSDLITDLKTIIRERMKQYE